MSSPRVVHCKKSEYDTYIGRDVPKSGMVGTKWQNPIKLTCEDERAEVLLEYKKYLLGNTELLNDLHELTGCTLGCWCYPCKCHGDLLVKYANSSPVHVRILIAGGRDFHDYELLCRVLDAYIAEMPYMTFHIVSGGANGADKLAERYARDRKVDNLILRANWNTFGRSAGYVRNSNMGKIADVAFIFWDLYSRGSKHMIEISKKLELDTRIQIYDEVKKDNVTGTKWSW